MSYRNSSGDSVEIQRLATFPRKRGDEEVRYSLDEFRAEGSGPARYVSIRLWYRQGSDWRPTTKGATVRRNELKEAIAALTAAAELLDSDAEPAPAGPPPQRQQQPPTHQDVTFRVVRQSGQPVQAPAQRQGAPDVDPTLDDEVLF